METQSKRVPILMVEDDPDDVLLLRETLEEARDISCTLTLAGNLAEAMKCLHGETCFDAVLLDMSLPDSC